jgi:hypothetical protein
MKNPIFATIFVSAYLILFCIFSRVPSMEEYAFDMFLASPFFVIWMVLTVLKDRKYKSPSLGNKEFGYRDRMI